ncbi:APC family permease [Lutispora thermophila]|uniref:Serine/threonine exchange transporter, LAT family (TC 2.A.3.8.12) n=1 Tax=Lutispora thermophila DSM 19022 TaxID=1122184 RepID=A0A1M6E1Z8_9FIRM|nr:amino acid permease [Lutispora thermophila]SHI79425.1 serine/threonine exchange transporter, LAT family (TC 2.A.3.8.12) [Lutispora thermophila DSM 19022]
MEENLKKSVTFMEAIALVVGMIIGSGIFLKPGIVFSNAGSPMMGVLAWIAGGVITLASALTVGEVASSIPKTGGLYVYLEELYGEVWGFMLGWVQTVISYPASGAALAIAFATYSAFFIPMTEFQQKLLAIAILVFVIIMNIISTKYGGIIQVISTIGKLIPIAGIVIFGLIKGTAHDFRSIPVITEGVGFGAAILGTLWAYDGWLGVTNMAGELKNPAKEMPRAIVLGVSTVTLIYALMNIAMLNVMPIEKIAASTRPVSDIAIEIFGNAGASLITAGIMISVFGAMNGYIMTGARVPLAMGERKQLPCSDFLAKIHESFGTPANALIIEGIIAIAYIFSGTFNTLTDLLVFVLWIFFVMGVFSIFILRKRVPVDRRPYKVPLYPITPIVGILGGIYIIYSTIISEPLNSIIGICIALVGLPVFYYLKRKNRVGGR